MRQEYQENGNLFDIAEIESTLPDGSKVTYDYMGNTYYALAPQYTNDGGHLNEAGRRIVVAQQLLLFLARLARIAKQ